MSPFGIDEDYSNFFAVVPSRPSTADAVARTLG